ncbi:MAG: mucoidy inhibitor MuiA family protein [Deltaproteobacteria bacterium]|nr:mucoidy inhibitor MuiA family protein [Deltaproteobacteria bacterium]
MRVERKVVGWILACGVSMMVMGCPPPSVVTSSPRHPVAAEVMGPAVVDVPEASNSQALPSKVTKVTVYSDRARVTRRATAQVSTEPTVFAFRKLPGWVDDGSVRVAVSAGRIVDVRVERNFLARATDRKWQKAKAKHQGFINQLAALNDEVSVLDAQRDQIKAIRAFSLAKINKDALMGHIKVTSYGEVLTFISNSLRATAKARRVVQRQREQITPDFQASQRQLAEMKNLMKLEETTVLVTLQGSRETPSTVDLTYMIPGATWEPMHDLRVRTSKSKTAEVVSFAVVTQTSGEDWRNAKLSFSTQSSTQSVRIPELEALTLGETHKATRILTSKMTSFRRAEQAFRKQGQMWNRAHQKASRRQRLSFDESYQRNIKYLQVVQSKTVRIFQGLQKRGTTAHFRAISAPSVRGDGHPVRMRIGRSVLATTQKIVAVPEQSLNAARTLEMTNSTKQSFLPGKVALYQDGAFLGMTDINFIAQGERFSLFLNVADHLKLSRKMDRKHSALVRKRRNKMRVAFIVTVENLSSEESVVALTDRIPLSENKEIKIDRVKISGGLKPNSQGLLHWTLKLAPKEKRQFRVAYQVEYPSELVLETRRQHKRALARRRRAGNRASIRAGNRPSVPAQQNMIGVLPRKKYKIGEQLMDLEAQF